MCVIFRLSMIYVCDSVFMSVFTSNTATCSRLNYFFFQGISHEVAREALKLGGQITIRQVTSTDRKLEVRERMKKRYSHKNYPDEFPFRCKCIVVFQNLGGVDVILLGEGSPCGCLRDPRKVRV